jgi:hypothetical protein
MMVASTADHLCDLLFSGIKSKSAIDNKEACASSCR